ncbi:MAG: hypothetical protein FWE07_09370 [Turicibacter sp.]|nr:hypothetical protein [Turicibacter sp.]
MKNKLNNYKAELEALKKELKTLPDGYLTKRREFYSHTIKRKSCGITKDVERIQELFRKRYVLERMEQLTNVLAPFSHLLEQLDNASLKNIFNHLPAAYQNAPISYFYHPIIKTWLKQNHRQNPYKPEERKYKTKNGIAMRSKSEVFIANLLEEYGIPYFYDVAVTLSGKTIYADFIIRNPFTGKLFIWEHFGALHQPGYERKMNEKMQLYMAHGYTPFDNLIYTFEFDVMNPKRLREMIEHIILG